MSDLSFYCGKRVFVTGHTGFKGSWLCRVLLNAGAEVTGYSLEPPTEPNLFSISGLKGKLTDIRGDIRDFDRLKAAFDEAKPELVFHLAAQPIVRRSYEEPRYTFETNVIGTVNLLECIRTAETPPRSFLNVTTDKVYLNTEREVGYREEDPLDGFDPYSNSKSCSELVTHSYARSFLADQGVAVSTARAGNVIGGGDFAKDRLIPDCVRAAVAGKPIILRNPRSVRPFQHVLEPVMAYLMIAARQWAEPNLAGWYNVGPEDRDCITVGELADLFCAAWGSGAHWEDRSEPDAPHEAGLLRLDCAKLKKTFGWAPRWDIRQAVERTVEWTLAWQRGEDIPALMDKQIKAFLEE